MKILLSNQFFYKIGGSETMFFKLLNFLKEEGYKISVLTVKNEKNFNIEGVKVYYTKNYFQQNKLLVPLNRIFNFHAYKITKKIIKNERPDIAHFYNTSQISPSPIIACIKEKIPVIKTFNDYEHFCPDSSKTKWSKFCDKEFGLYNCLTCDRINVKPSLPIILYYIILIKNFELSIFRKTINISICEMIKKVLDQSKINSRVIYQSISLPKNVPKIKHTGKILYAGRLSKEKGVEYLLQSLKIINNQKAQLLIAGDGPERSKLEYLVKKLNLKDKVKFLGFLNKSELQKLYENIDFMVLPSIWQEPFGLTGLESMSYARPVIAFNVGGINEYISDNKDGFLVEVFDVNKLAEKMELFLNDKNILMKFSKESRKKARKFSDEVFFKNIKKLYKEVLNY